MSLLLSSLSAIATLYLALQISLIKKFYIRESRANQLERTINAMQLQPLVNQTIGEVLRRHFRGDNGIFDNPKLEVEIIATLNALETLAAGILSEVYDEEIAYSQLGYSLPLFYETIQRYIYQSRESFSSASQFVQLERLARRWRDKERAFGHTMGVKP